MSSLIIIDSNIKDLDILKNSIKKEHKILINNDNTFTNQEIYNNINEDIKYLTFVYHFQGYYQIPFFNNQKYENYSYFSTNLIELLKTIKEKTKELTLDLLTCDLNNIYFASEVKKIENDLGIKIRFSVNKTGNLNGDWIFESDNTNIKNFYFNEDIINWKYSLSGGMTTDELVTTYPSYFFKDGLVTKLLQNATNSNIGISNNSTDYIILNNGEIFDGQNYTISFGSNVIYGLFKMPFVSESINSPTIENLKITLTTGTVGVGLNPGGGIVGNNQQFFKVNNCILTTSVSGSIQSESGGICGAYCGIILNNLPGNAIIENSYTTCNINGYGSGGICGSYGGYFGKITIKKCYSTGTINGENAGGISGTQFGYSSSTSVIEGCYSRGVINGNNAGGICGSYVSNNINSNNKIDKCYSLGNIIGTDSGGICGSYCANAGYLTISECFSIGTITGISAGGITGSNCGNNNSGNMLEVTNCYSIGSLNGSQSGGILGSNCGFGSGNFKVIKCYSVGITNNLSRQGGIVGYNGGLNVNPTTRLIENCYCALVKLAFSNSRIQIVNSETNLNKIKNKIDEITNFDTSSIWKIPSSSTISLNIYPRLQAFSNPESIYYLNSYMSYNNRLDYSVNNTEDINSARRLNIDINYYTNMTDAQIYELRSLIITNAFNTISPTIVNLICSKEGLGFSNQTNANSFQKVNYYILKANNSNFTSYILNTYISDSNGIYINLVNETDKAFVTLSSGTIQLITKNENLTYTFEAISP